VLEKFYKRKIISVWREEVEVTFDKILEKIVQNKGKIYSLLVVGDPLCATTHTDIYLRAVKLGIKVHIIHNASIMNAIGCTGLHVYDFGQTVSMCFFTET